MIAAETVGPHTTGGGPEPNNPLAPYYPTETPSVSGNGRKWFAVLFALMVLLGAANAVLSPLVSPLLSL